ncbi:MAG TPA: Ig-like domain-containing protein, partial [Gemmatimonadales bacterium]
MSALRLAAAAALAFAAVACNETVEPLDLAGAPAAIAASSGDAQIAAVSTGLAAPIAVRVSDADGRPVPGVVVNWTASAGTLSQESDTTGNDGVASVGLTMPATAGTITIAAEVEGLAPVTFTATATPGAGLLTFRYVEAGSYHACGITTSEESVCWGFNEDGQVGAGMFSTVAPMTRVSTDRTVRMASGGRHHSCEITLAGEVWCGGSPLEDRTGNAGGAAFQRVSFDRAARVIQAGLLHSCALTLSNQLWCWGSNGEGQLGTGPATPLPGNTASTAVFVTNDIAAVSTSGLHTCALNRAGQALCWGWNESGQLGNGTTTTSGVPEGVGGFTFRIEPDVVPHAPDPDFYIPGQSYISAGFAHTCGITTGDNVVCWGENESGQLGRGSFNDASTPGAIIGGLDWRAVSAGFKHTCALTTDGAAYCWGDNAFGQLGDGTEAASNVPVPVAAGLTF